MLLQNFNTFFNIVLLKNVHCTLTSWNTIPNMKVICYLDELHDQVELTVGVHFLDQQNYIGVFHPPQNGHFILDHMFLCTYNTTCVNNKYYRINDGKM